MGRSQDVYKVIQFDIFGVQFLKQNHKMRLSLVYSLFPKLLPHKEVTHLDLLAIQTEIPTCGKASGLGNH